MFITTSTRIVARSGISHAHLPPVLQQLSNQKRLLSQSVNNRALRHCYTQFCTHAVVPPTLQFLTRSLATNSTVPDKSLASSDRDASNLSSSPSSSTSSSSQSTSPLQEPNSILNEIREYAANAERGAASKQDHELIPSSEAKVFPRIKTTSLSTKRIVISDEASRFPVTLVQVAFRSIADEQLKPWREAFVSSVGPGGRWYDVTVNESFAAQALSGFVQRWQRGRTDPQLHDFYVAFNNYAKEPLEGLLLSTNRMYGNILLLDRHARVRFRAFGAPEQSGIDTFLSCAHQLINDH